jgi:tetratricopeptide (TPR) repeat protein
MNELVKNFIVIVLIVFSLLGIIFGAYIPFKKAQLYISAAYQMNSIRTTKQFEEVFDKVFNYNSPIGDYEVARFLGDNLLNLIAAPENPENVSRFLLEYLEPKMKTDDTRHLLLLAQMYYFLWQKSGKESDFLKSEEYYQKALNYGPKLPQLLYGLFDLYKAKGDKEKLKQVAETILKYWPEDEKVKEALR